MGYSLTDKVVLVTGASSGIGEAIALAAAAQGAKVVLAARREGVLHTIADLVSKQGGTPLVIPTDMADTAQVENLAAQAIAHFGRVDVLINNAGYGQMGPIEEVSEAAVRRQFDVNVFGVLTLTRALIPGMRARRDGCIVNISSIAGKISMPLMGIYNASKHALEALSDSLRLELAPFGIRVIVIEPGPVTTEFFQVASERTAAVVDPAGPYGRALEKTAESLNSTGFAWTSAQTAALILKGITADRPQDRYVAAKGGQLGLNLIQSLPTAWSDKVFSNMFGLDQLSEDVPS